MTAITRHRRTDFAIVAVLRANIRYWNKRNHQALGSAISVRAARSAGVILPFDISTLNFRTRSWRYDASRHHILSEHNLRVSYGDAALSNSALFGG
jgi:hypothetical protein